MSELLISTKALKELASAGVVNSATIVGVSWGVVLIVRYGSAQRTLQALRGGVRVFKTIDAVAKFLKKDLNLTHADLDMTQWEPP